MTEFTGEGRPASARELVAIDNLTGLEKFLALRTTSPKDIIVTLDVIREFASALVDALKVDRAGDTMTGDLTLTGTTNRTLEVENDGATARFLVTRYSPDASAPSVQGRKSRNTKAAPAIVNTNDSILNIIAQAHDGSTFVSVGTGIFKVVAAAPSNTDLESSFTLQLVAPGAAVVTDMIGLSHAAGLLLRGTVVIDKDRHFLPRAYLLTGLPAQDTGKVISENSARGLLISDGTRWKSPGVLNAQANNANTSVIIPAGYELEHIAYENTTANAVTGGVKIGTSSGGTQVVVAQAVGANAIGLIAEANILLRIFSSSATQTLFIQPVTSWNSAVVNFGVAVRKVF